MTEEDSEPEPMMEEDLVNHDSDNAMASGNNPMTAGPANALSPIVTSPGATPSPGSSYSPFTLTGL